MNHTFWEYLKAYGLLILYLSPFVIVEGWIVYKYGRKSILNEKEYETRYEELSNIIRQGIATEQRKEYIRLQIRSIEALPFKNVEKTSVLWHSFYNACEAMKEPKEDPVEA